MPRLVKYTTSGIVDDVPDMALAVIEHTALFYLIDQRFSGRNKYIAFAVAGAGYEVVVASIKAQDADKSRKSD
tara:strand:+ start:666 stop:884 length:219 start_codon:yes stop_codon:yes gene_type:complete